MVDDIEAQGALADKVNRTVADQLEADNLRAKRKAKEGKSYVSEEVAEQAKVDVASFNRDLESVQGDLESRYGHLNAPHVRSTPGPDDAPAFSASEKSATKDAKNLSVIEEPDKLQTETIVGAPDVTETGVLGEPLPESAKRTKEFPQEEEEDKDSKEDEVEEKNEATSGDDLKPDKTVKKAVPAKKAAAK